MADRWSEEQNRMSYMVGKTAEAGENVEMSVVVVVVEHLIKAEKKQPKEQVPSACLKK